MAFAEVFSGKSYPCPSCLQDCECHVDADMYYGASSRAILLVAWYRSYTEAVSAATYRGRGSCEWVSGIVCMPCRVLSLAHVASGL